MPLAGNSYVVDTSAVICFRRGNQQAFRKFQDASMLHLPCVALGELYYGSSYAPDPKRSLRELEELLPAFVLQPVTRSIAEVYGRIKVRLRQAGTPIPENDIWIAATALDMGLALLAQDGHFEKVLDLNYSRL